MVDIACNSGILYEMANRRNVCCTSRFIYSEFTFTRVFHGKVVVCNLSQLALIEKGSIFFIHTFLFDGF